jgi:hypothetical protein
VITPQGIKCPRRSACQIRHEYTDESRRYTKVYSFRPIFRIATVDICLPWSLRYRSDRGRSWTISCGGALVQPKRLPKLKCWTIPWPSSGCCKWPKDTCRWPVGWKSGRLQIKARDEPDRCERAPSERITIDPILTDKQQVLGYGAGIRRETPTSSMLGAQLYLRCRHLRCPRRAVVAEGSQRSYRIPLDNPTCPETGPCPVAMATGGDLPCAISSISPMHLMRRRSPWP